MNPTRFIFSCIGLKMCLTFPRQASSFLSLALSNFSATAFTATESFASDIAAELTRCFQN